MMTTKHDNPFVGPRPFERGEKLYGRTREVRELFYLLTAERIVWLHSPSGAGKTSLIDASLIPRLQQDGFAVYHIIRVNLDLSKQQLDQNRPTVNRYLLSTLVSLEEGLTEDKRRTCDELSTLSLADYLATRCSSEGTEPNIVLVFDQFEEILTIDPLQDAQKRMFFQQVGEALRNENRWALFSLREEFLTQMEPYIDWIPTRWSNTFRLDLLGEKAVYEVVKKTAMHGDREFTDSAAEALFKDLAKTKVQQPNGSFLEEDGHYVEPVQLQVVCLRLWDEMPKDDPCIDLEDLEQFGDVSEALGAYYGNEVTRIAGDDFALERRIYEWFGKRLITPSGIRGQVLRGKRESEGLANEVIEQLMNTHLVRGEKRAGATWYELAHDRLVQPVGESYTAWLKKLQPFQRRAAAWEEQGRPDDFLLKGQKLKVALKWQKNHYGSVTDGEDKFLSLSRKARRRRIGIMILIIFSVTVILWFAVNAELSKKEAEGKAREATEQLARANWIKAFHELEAAASADNNLDPDAANKNREKAAHYLAKAAEGFHEAEEDSLAINAQLAQEVLTQYSNNSSGFSKYQELILTGRVRGVVFSNDGQRILTFSRGGGALLWDSESGKQFIISALKDERGVVGAQFNSDGSRLLTWTYDGTARLWDIEMGQSLTQPFELEGGISGGQFNSDGSRFLTWGQNNTWTGGATAQLWDSMTGQSLTPPIKNEGGVSGAQISLDGRRFFIWDKECNVRVWNEASSHSPEIIGGPCDEVRVSGDGRYLFFSSWKQSILIRRPSDNKVITLNGVERIDSAKFNRDGSRILTWTYDGTAGLWDSGTGEELTSFKIEDVFQGAVFNGDGNQILTWTHDGIARLWDSEKGVPVTPPFKHKAAIWGAVFNTDEDRVLTWSQDGTARVWGVKMGEALTPPLEHGRDVLGARFNANGSLILTWGRNGKVVVWDVWKGLSRVLLSHKDTIRGAVFNRDENMILTWSRDGTARLWDRISGKELIPPLKHEDEVLGALFNADESRILTWSWDGTARLWDVKTGKQITSPFRHDGSVNGATFNSGGNLILTWSRDGTVGMWDSQTGKQLLLLKDENLVNGAAVNGAAFNNDESQILTWSSDDIKRLWDVKTGTVLKKERNVKDLFGDSSETSISKFSLQVSLLESDFSVDRVGKVRILDLSSLMLSPWLEHLGLLDVLVSNKTGRVLSWGTNGTVKIWDSINGSEMLLNSQHQLSHDSPVIGASFNDKGDRIISWDMDGIIRTWNSKTGERMVKPMRHSDLVGAKIMKQYNRVLTWGRGGSLNVWDGGMGSQLIQGMKHDGFFQDIEFSNNGEFFATWGDNIVRVWDLRIDEKWRNWPLNKSVLKLEVITHSTLAKSGEVVPLSGERYIKKKCEYDETLHTYSRNQLKGEDWIESQNKCREIR